MAAQSGQLATRPAKSLMSRAGLFSKQAPDTLLHGAEVHGRLGRMWPIRSGNMAASSIKHEHMGRHARFIAILSHTPRTPQQTEGCRGRDEDSCWCSVLLHAQGERWHTFGQCYLVCRCASLSHSCATAVPPVLTPAQGSTSLRAQLLWLRLSATGCHATHTTVRSVPSAHLKSRAATGPLGHRRRVSSAARPPPLSCRGQAMTTSPTSCSCSGSSQMVSPGLQQGSGCEDDASAVAL